MRFSLSQLILSILMSAGACGVLETSASAQVQPVVSPVAAPNAASMEVLFHPLSMRIGLVFPTGTRPTVAVPPYPNNGDPGDGDPGGGNPGGGNPGGGDPGDDDDPPDSGGPPTHHQPEPATLLSALLGAGTLTWYGWRKRRRP